MTRDPVASAATQDEKDAAPVTIDTSLCKACGICVGLCPKDVLDQEPGGLATASRRADCTACRICELHCPEFAIGVKARARRRPVQANSERD